MKLSTVLQESGNTVSLSQARRLICMEAVKVNGVLVTDLTTELDVTDVVQVGKKAEFTVGSVLLKMDFPLQ